MQFVGGVNLAGQTGHSSQLLADFLCHGCGAAAEFRGGEDVAGLVDERAGEVLALREDDAGGEAFLKVGLGGAGGFAVQDDEGVD